MLLKHVCARTWPFSLRRCLLPAARRTRSPRFLLISRCSLFSVRLLVRTTHQCQPRVCGLFFSHLQDLAFVQLQDSHRVAHPPGVKDRHRADLSHGSTNRKQNHITAARGHWAGGARGGRDKHNYIPHLPPNAGHQTQASERDRVWLGRAPAGLLLWCSRPATAANVRRCGVGASDTPHRT